jgi:hypothetical protein
MRNLLAHPGPTRLAAGLGVLAMSGAVAACGSSSPKAAPVSAKASAAAPASMSVVAACRELAQWENGNATDTLNVDLESKTISQQMAGTQFGTDFNDWMQTLDGSGGNAEIAASGVTADCNGVGLQDVVLNTDGSAASASPSAAPPSPSAAPAPTMTRQTDTVLFKVSGSGYPSIQYGSDNNSNSPPGGYGPLGDGNALPWSASLTYDSGALYYAVSAQLEGYGNISDSVTEVITTSCSDGSHKTESFPLASGHASGGYTIAQAEYAGGDTGNATQAESDAGC